MKIALVPSCNGRGHFRRSKSIAIQLQKLGHEVSLFWDRRFPIVERTDEFEITRVVTPLLFDGPYARELGLNRDFDSPEKLRAFDLVISDTTTWPTEYHNNVVIVGQFTWDNYWIAHGQTINYRRNPQRVKKINAFGMDVFSWPSIKSEYNFSPLKVLDYWNLMEVMNEKTSEVIGVSFGASGEVNKFLSNLMGTAGAMPVRGLNHFYQENGFLPKIVVSRAGIGIVSECISAQIPMLLVNDSDLEIQFNESIITDLGIGSVLNLDKLKSRDYLAQQIYEISDYRKPKSWPETVHTSSICDILLGGDYCEQT